MEAAQASLHQVRSQYYSKIARQYTYMYAQQQPCSLNILPAVHCACSNSRRQPCCIAASGMRLFELDTLVPVSILLQQLPCHQEQQTPGWEPACGWVQQRQMHL
jgi:hypothetical protein